AQGLRVLGYNRSDRRREAAELGVELRSLEGVLAESDYVVVAVAANPRTRHLIGERELSLMRPTARLINVSRGVVVDEEALATRLSDGRLAGAGLDVFTEEPLKTDSPLIALDNVVLAPHSLCWTDQYTAAVSASVMASLIAVSRSERPAETVNGPFPDGTWPRRNEDNDERDRT
ncbi:hypothetical protein JBE27_36135, partial [Streptomyces albiflaviniger]|nr:hypothetical protein [Streptomyces albiflaviniger]